MASLEEAISVLGDTAQPRGRRCLAVKAVYLLGDFQQRTAADRLAGDPAIEDSRWWAARRIQRRDRRGMELDSWMKGLAETADLEYWEDAKRIGFLGARRATRPLIRLVRESTEPDRRAAALHALWLLGDVRATQVCLQVGANMAASGEERLIAVEALGMSAHLPHVQQALIWFLTDPLPKVRYSALCAIGAWWARAGRISRELREALQKATKDPTSLYEDGDIARFAAELLTPMRIGSFCEGGAE